MKLPSLRLTLRAGVVCTALFAAGIAVSQVSLPQLSAMSPGDLIQDVPNGLAQSTSYFVNSLQVRSFVLGQNSQHLSAPTLTVSGAVCGGSTGAINGTDVQGQITMGTSASTNCTVTFAAPYASPPSCFVAIDNAVDNALKCHTTDNTAVITETSASNNLINYEILGQKGG